MPCKCAERKAAMKKWLEQHNQKMLSDLLSKIPAPKPKPPTKPTGQG